MTDNNQAQPQQVIGTQFVPTATPTEEEEEDRVERAVWGGIRAIDAVATAQAIFDNREFFTRINEGRFNINSIMQEYGVTPTFHAAVVVEFNRISTAAQRVTQA